MKQYSKNSSTCRRQLLLKFFSSETDLDQSGDRVDCCDICTQQCCPEIDSPDQRMVCDQLSAQSDGSVDMDTSRLATTEQLARTEHVVKIYGKIIQELKG